jgi:hypothetical protein
MSPRSWFNFYDYWLPGEGDGDGETTTLEPGSGR